MGYAIAIMGVALLALLSVLVGIVAAHTAKGVGILETILRLLAGDEPLPAQQPRKPWNRAAVVASAQRARAADSAGRKFVGLLDERDASAGPPHDRRSPWVRCSPDGSRIAPADSEPTPRSPVDYRSGLHPIVDARGEVVSPMAASVEVAAFRSVPEVPPLGEDEERAGWERRSGFWTRRDG